VVRIGQNEKEIFDALTTHVCEVPCAFLLIIFSGSPMTAGGGNFLPPNMLLWYRSDRANDL